MTGKKEIYLIPYAHLDTQWRWEYPTTIKKYIKSTLDENIYLFEKYPEHQFNFTGALRYAMMKEYYPDKFHQIKKYIEENRWHISGTCLDETDALTPGVESMIRNILYGDKWAKNEFGKSSRDYMIPDCFGFPANMPTVLAHCGIHGFSSQKLTWNSAVGIPFEIGIWKGPDGSELVSALNPCSYNSRLRPPVHKNSKRLDRLFKLGEKNNIWKSFQYYGVGDIGGAPTEGSVKRAILSINNASIVDEELEIKQSSADQFFSELTNEEKERMDSYSGDLLLINHSAGTLTSAAIMKRWNRKNEQLAFAAEVAAITAQLIAGAMYPSEKIKSAWYRIIGNQMHDILPGTSTPIAYQYSQNDEVVALKTWKTIIEDSALSIAPFVSGDGTILLFNPLGEARSDIVDIELFDWDESADNNVTIKDADGKSYSAQIQKRDDGKIIASFIPDLKPLSWSRFSISKDSQNNKTETSNAVTIKKDANSYSLENSIYVVKITFDGKIESIYHKELNKELLKKPIAYEFQKERPSLYPAWNMDWKDRKKEPFERLENGNKVSIVEEGPIRCTIQIITEYNSSVLEKSISLSSESKIVEFSEHINWRESGCSLKLALNVNMNKQDVTYNWESSRTQRGINKETLFEMPSRLWVDMSDDKWGFSIIEDSKYGYDHPSDDTLRMTLLYTPGIWYMTGYWDQKSQDWGEHTIRYGIYIHEGDFKGTDYYARLFNQKVRSFLIEDDKTSEVKDNISLFEIPDKQLGILSVKKAEDSDGILIRVYERYGKDINTKIICNIPFTEVMEVNGLEEVIGIISKEGNSFTVNIEGNSIHSYIIIPQKIEEKNKIKQKSLKLPYNTKLISKKESKNGFYPNELTPSKIYAGSIIYDLEIDEEYNSLQCNGQNISIPENFNEVSILISSKEDCQATFKWLDQGGKILNEEAHHLSSMKGFIGQWDTRIWKRKPKRHLKYKRDYVWRNKCVGVTPGFINRKRLEWYTTHTHINGEDQPYQYGYMYTITLNVPNGAKSLALPDDNRLFILAMTVSQQSIKLKNSQYLKDKFDF